MVGSRFGACGGGRGSGGCGWSSVGGITALHLVVLYKHVGVVRAMVAARADTQVHGATLLREEGMVEMEQMLLAAGAAGN